MIMIIRDYGNPHETNEKMRGKKSVFLKILTSVDRRYKPHITHHHQQQQQHMSNPSFTCPICYDDKISNEFQFFSGCTHGVCKQCYRQLRNMTCPLCRSDISSDFSMRERRSVRTRMENDSYDRLLTFAQEIEPEEDVNVNAVVVVHQHRHPRVVAQQQQQRTYQRRPTINNINNNNLPRTPWDCLVYAFGGQ